VNAHSIGFEVEGDQKLQDKVATLRKKFDPTGLFDTAIAARFKNAK